MEVLGVVPKPPRRESLLETSTKVLQTRLGPLYPVLLLGQSLVCRAACAARAAAARQSLLGRLLHCACALCCCVRCRCQRPCGCG